MKLDDTVSSGGKHAPDLMIAPLGEGKPGDAGLQNLQISGGQRSFFSLEHQVAPGEDVGFVAPERPLETRNVSFWGMRTWRNDTMQEGAVVRDQQQSRGVPVQTPDRRQRRGAAAPPGRQE